jgi:hypothetical protein
MAWYGIPTISGAKRGAWSVPDSAWNHVVCCAVPWGLLHSTSLNGMLYDRAIDVTATYVTSSTFPSTVAKKTKLTWSFVPKTPHL